MNTFSAIKAEPASRSAPAWPLACRTALALAIVATALQAQAKAIYPSPGIAGGVQIVAASFGLIDNPDAHLPGFTVTNVVPLKPDQAYGWMIQLRTQKQTVRWREEFTLPAPPANWGVDEILGKRTISGGGTTSVLERTVVPGKNGVISNMWSVLPGDPPGRYRIRVLVEDKVLRTFEFDVR
ncbi:hypothetical protein IGB42_02978 [Andreprevotia sp. IGB-42]|uniref:hypothetical protein n=1 Tax=Andreprevotia sp. IGB-42 TaxID=2497473 RepID=UPI0013593354|nr:hypothetical protein [Andreprevotia sp. IGB-42]KAF0812686.1 hypothetical protein IGB42_02978 [Andreprevotia sp. IGB-42]